MPGSNATGLLLALLTALFWGPPLASSNICSPRWTPSPSSACALVAAAWTWGLSCRYPGNSTPLGRREKLLLVLAAAGLSCNFVFFNSSVAYLSASACRSRPKRALSSCCWAACSSCASPFLPIQRSSVIILLAGLLLFFNTRLLELASGDMLIGMALGIMAAVVWAGYGIAQKICCARSRPGGSCASSILPVPWP